MEIFFFGFAEKQFDKKAKVNFKIYDIISIGQQIITIHTLCNISRSKDNPTMKFVQLIEYNMRKNVHKKLYAECGLRHFYKR